MRRWKIREIRKHSVKYAVETLSELCLKNTFAIVVRYYSKGSIIQKTIASWLSLPISVSFDSNNHSMHVSLYLMNPIQYRTPTRNEQWMCHKQCKKKKNSKQFEWTQARPQIKMKKSLVKHFVLTKWSKSKNWFYNSEN